MGRTTEPATQGAAARLLRIVAALLLAGQQAAEACDMITFATRMQQVGSQRPLCRSGNGCAGSF